MGRTESKALRVLVTGGTGHLGSRLVPRLRARGHMVRVATRHPSARDHVFYDLAEPPPLADVDVVVHLASDPRSPERDVEAMHRLVAAGSATGLDHLLLMSIVGIDGHPLPYYRAKSSVEEVLAAAEVPWIIQRATQFHGFVPRLCLLFGGRIPAGYRIQPVEAEAVAARLVELVATGPVGRATDVGGPEVVDAAEALHGDTMSDRPCAGAELFIAEDPIAQAFVERRGLLGPDGDVIGVAYTEYLRRSSTT